MYEKELNAIKKSNLYRQRKIFDEKLIDLASNDYLGLSSNETLFKNAYENVLKQKYKSPKASILVNGYSQIHKKFEDDLKKANKFEEALVVGSGFLANVSMIEALVRKGDTLFIDEEYHASGILATKLLKKEQVILFSHNDYQDLENKIKTRELKGRFIIAIEGVYSMSGNIAHKEFFDISNKYDALLIVDEAHSSGVIGENLLGIFDYYNIKPQKNHIKMGTLGKAYGSYGAYILSSKNIIDFLINRAKAVIYTTAPSLFDIALANESLKYILSNTNEIKTKIKNRQKVIKEELDIESKSLITAYEIGENKKVLEIQKKVLENGYIVGAIRQPTVKSAIIRLISKIDVSIDDLQKVCKLIKI
ncbi:aminotransferase class I/II-fold pyridoxal phosphate-dependent enzyme [Arcobacter sp.]|uniref:aminotransferase class I/II-fold pyridoxal phosphate-dependent enzyme n=1 Tax=unclassified Arcobacter TaxID=2593671 RepID=UPI003AFF87EC